MHTTQRRDSLGVRTSAQTSLRTITSKAGNSIILGVLYCTPSPRSSNEGSAGGQPLVPGRECQIEHPFQFPGPGGEAGLAILHFVAGAEVLVGDVEGCEHRDFQRVARRTLLERQPHLLVD